MNCIYNKVQHYKAKDYRSMQFASIVCNLIKKILVNKIVNHAEETIKSLQREFRRVCIVKCRSLISLIAELEDSNL